MPLFQWSLGDPSVVSASGFTEGSHGKAWESVGKWDPICRRCSIPISHLTSSHMAPVWHSATTSSTYTDTPKVGGPTEGRMNDQECNMTSRVPVFQKGPSLQFQMMYPRYCNLYRIGAVGFAIKGLLYRKIHVLVNNMLLDSSPINLC